MHTHRKRRFTVSLWIVALLFLVLSTFGPTSSGQQPAAADLPALVKELKNKDAKQRAEAVRRLTGLGEAARPAVPALVKALSDSDAKVRYRAVIALGRLWSGNESGPEIQAAVPSLIKLLNDNDEYTRKRTVFALRQIGPGAHAALPALNAIRGDRNNPLWIEAFTAINDIERPATDDVSTLAGLLKDKDPKVRNQAAERLSSMGMKAIMLKGRFKGEAAIPALIDALKDSESQVRYHALSALNWLMDNRKPPDLATIVPTVTELLADAYDGTRWQAAAVLGEIGPPARTAVPLLTKALADSDDTVRGSAAEALEKIGPESKVAVPQLIKLLKDPSDQVRESAADAIARLDPGSAQVVVASLTEDLKHEKPEFRGRAARALGSFGPEAKSATPQLANMLKTEEYTWRYAIVLTLEKIGPGAREAVPALRDVLNDRLGYIRLAAAVALLKIAPESKAEIPPDLLEQANEKTAEKEEDDEEEVPRILPGYRTPEGEYIPPANTIWDEAIDLVHRGFQFYKQGNLDAAVASFTEAIKIDPEFVDAYHQRGSIYRIRREYIAAVDDFTKAAELDPRPARHYLARGLTNLNRRDYNAAIADTTQVIKLNAFNAEAYYVRGLAHHYKNNFDLAIADYDRALEIVPPEKRALGARGTAKLAQGNVAEAIADLTKAIEVHPSYPLNYEALGDAYTRQGDLEKARAAWGKALALSSDVVEKTRIAQKLNSAGKQ